MIIRTETDSDIAAVRQVNIAAFADHPISQQTEHLIVDALRNANVLAISLVAEDQGKVVGHIAFSPTPIDGADLGWYTLGPVGVLPECQKRGIGSKLIREGLKRLRERGARGCCLVGDPSYYRRFGFRNTPDLGIEGVPPEYFMCLPLAGDIPAGHIELHPAFFVTADHASGVTE